MKRRGYIYEKKINVTFINRQPLYLQAAEAQMIILRKELQLQQKVSRKLLILLTLKYRKKQQKLLMLILMLLVVMKKHFRKCMMHSTKNIPI